ncbi:MFS transporter [Candidatus Enterococcus murrayae]|uniref:MFS transporter n=1 Tax=Candidatus Enterococcus murrayae TaxID=2815321 RepID=A0ABS3HFR0_9ENTE|nr:MFS transporter [Enterococcus sp. MJM16]MBO0452284.1 MFS transporter [Enterococcus sp. MJM16]
MNRVAKSALLSVSLLVVTGGAIAGNIPAIAQAYPDINATYIELLTTIPSFFIITTVLISPKIAQVIGKKRTVQLGILLVIISGAMPAATSSFFSLFLSRLLFGIGVGLFNPLLYSLAATFFKGRELASVIGLQSAFEGIGGMLFTFTVGQLLLVSWRVSFFTYFLAIPILLAFSFFVPETETAAIEKHQDKRKRPLTPQFVRYLILLLITVTVYMSIAVKVTAFFVTKGIGNATDGSNYLAIVGLGAMLAGILFGRIVSILKKWTLPAAYLLLGFSLILLAFSTNLVMAALSAALCGFGFRTFIPYIFNEINQQAENAERNTSILLITFNIGSAFAPISIALLQGLLPVLTGAGLFVGEGALMIALAVILTIMEKKPLLVSRTNHLFYNEKRRTKRNQE